MKYYVSIVRGKQVSRLLGPYDTREEAEKRVPDARRLAEQVDSFSAFDSFGVSGWAPPSSKVYPPGKLNHLL
jgi:hypothetical protein